MSKDSHNKEKKSSPLHGMKRIRISVLTGCVLGFFCVLGVSMRQQLPFTDPLIWQIFYNRIILAVVVGLSGQINLKPYIRGAAAGLVVSFSLYIGSGFSDFITFFAGIVYGVIIDMLASRYEK